MKKNALAFLSMMMFNCTLMAQSFSVTEKGVKATTNDGSIETELQFYTPSIIHVVKTLKGKITNDSSLVVIASPEKVKFTTKKQGNNLLLKSSELSASLNLKTGAITYSSAKGKLLLKDNGAPSIIPGKELNEVAQSFTLDKDEAIYGLGQTQSGKMSQRGITKYMVQSNQEDFIPFIISVKGYGLYWDNPSPTTFTDNAQGTSFKSEIGSGVDYYFMTGENADGVIANMRHISGKVPMLPLWTYGFWQSKERYKSQEEIVGVVKKYRELGVPLDGIIQDWQYWGNNYLWNAMEFMNYDYNKPKKMVNDIHNLNAHIIISIWSSFGPMTKPFRELEKIGALWNIRTWPESGISEVWPPIMDYPSGVKVYDAYNPAARDIYWKYLNQGIFSTGVDGWWMDSTEPDHFGTEKDFDLQTYLGSWRKVRNAYPLMSVESVYKNQRKVNEDKRVFILTRSAFAGQQRTGANTWTGDIQASWETLRKQIPAGLNFSLCANPNWNTDIGGFFLSNYRKKIYDKDYQELMVRWMQFGAFCPMMRSHGADAPREIYQFGKKGEPVFDGIAAAIKMRYKFLPYIYSTSWDVSNNNSTMMRALAMDYVSDKKTWDIADEYMFGKSLLIAPFIKSIGFVADSMKVDNGIVKLRNVYLPKGDDWYEMDTNILYKGGKVVTKESVAENALLATPVYVRAGSIIPIGPDVQFSNEKSWKELNISVYPGKDAIFTLYEDEGDNYNYEKGDYSTITFQWNDKAHTLTILPRKGSFKGMIENRIFKINLLNQSKDVEYNGDEVVVNF